MVEGHALVTEAQAAEIIELLRHLRSLLTAGYVLAGFLWALHEYRRASTRRSDPVERVRRAGLRS